MMLPAACCSLHVARCTLHVAATASAERNLRCTFQFPGTRNGNGKGDTVHWAMGTVSVGGHVWPSVACNYPNANLVLIRVDTLHWERASCNQCQNDCGLTGENLWFDPCIFCHLSSRVGLESSWRRAAWGDSSPPPLAVHSGQSTPTHVRLSVRRFVLPSSSSSVSASFCACSRLQFTETRTAAAAGGEGVRGRGADTAHAGGSRVGI